jgi:hypothetical protein
MRRPMVVTLRFEERGRVEACIELLEQHERIEGNAREIGGAPPSGEPTGGPGDRFIKSDGYKMISAAASRALVERPRRGDESTATSSEGDAARKRCRRPWWWTRSADVSARHCLKLLEPLGVADVFGQSQTTM